MMLPQATVVGQSNPTNLRRLWLGCIAGWALTLIVVVLIVLGAAGKLSVNRTSCPFALGAEIRNSTSDHIGLVFNECPSAAAFAAFNSAAATWNKILSGTSVGTFSLGTFTSVQELCGENFLSTTFDFGSGASLDHLVIFVEPKAIDGVNGVLAESAPCSAFTNDPLLPLVGGMLFDNADLDLLQTEGILDRVVLHEMAHVLGYGTLWDFVSEGGHVLTTSDTADALIQNEIFIQLNNGSVLVNATAQPKFVGSLATAEFNAMQGSGTSESTPLEDGRNSSGDQTFDIANGDGQGSIDSHWKITVFENELMTFAIDPADAEHPLSALTLQSMADLGYVVDINLADSYSLPSSSAGRADSNLRGTKSNANSNVHYLHGDVKRHFKKQDIIPLTKISP